MNWATAAGVGGISAGLITLVIGLIVLVNKVVAKTEEAGEARASQLDAEAFKREAEDQRDAALAACAKAIAERDACVTKYISLERDYVETRARLERKMLDAVKDDDLVVAGRDILGMRPHVPEAGGSGTPPT